METLCLERKPYAILWYASTNINEVIMAVLKPLLFFYEKILHTPKAQKAQKRNRAKVQNATSEQKFCLKNIKGENSNLFAYLCFCAHEEKKTRKKGKVPQWKCTKY